MTCFETCTVFVPLAMSAYNISVHGNVIKAVKASKIKLTCYGSRGWFYSNIFRNTIPVGVLKNL